MMKLLKDDDIRSCLPVWAAIEANRKAFLYLHRGLADVPERIILPVGKNGVSLFKPCSVRNNVEKNCEVEKDDVDINDALGLKVINVRPDNAKKGLVTTPAVIMLFDPVTGFPECIMNGTYLTALRTAAGSALATYLCSKPESSSLLVFGAGLQAEAHVLTILCVRDIKTVTIVNRGSQTGKNRALGLIDKLKKQLQDIFDGKMYTTREEQVNLNSASEPITKKPKLSTFNGMQTKILPTFHFIASEDSESLEQCVKSADIICTATGSPTPLFKSKWLKEYTHINAVGSYQAHTTELDVETVMSSKIIVDTMAAFEAGDLLKPFQNCSDELKQKHLIGALGEVLHVNDIRTSNGALTAAKYQQCDPSIAVTVFKSVGCSVQDAVTATVALKYCDKANIGENFKM